VTVFFGTPEIDGAWDIDAGALGAQGDWLLVVPSVKRLEGKVPATVKASGGVLVSLSDCCRLADGRVVASEAAKNACDYVLRAKAASSGDSVWSTEVYGFELNGSRTVAYCGRYLCGNKMTPKRFDVEYAGRVRLALEDSALQFNVIGNEPLELGRLLRVLTSGDEALVEFEGGVVRHIDFVSYPDLDNAEKDCVRSGKHQGPIQTISHFRSLPLAKTENDFRRIQLPKRRAMDLSRKWKCRPVLREIWEHCKKTGSGQFLYENVRLDGDGNLKTGMPKSDRLRDDVFKDLKAEFDVMFDTVGSPTAEEYRLKVRFE
jgi:hypothetical protein